MHGETQFHEGGTGNYRSGNEDANEEPPNFTLSPSNVNAKRKRVGKGDQKFGTTNRLQQSLNFVVHVLDRDSNITITEPKPKDLYNYNKCLPLLNEVPNLMKGSH